MFFAQSLENGFLWPNFVAACNQNFASILDACVVKAKKEMEATVEAKFTQVGSSLHGKLEGSVGNLKAWVAKELRSFDQIISHRFKDLETKQAEVSARTSSKCERERDFETKVEQRFMTLEKIVMNCMNGLHAVRQKVECSDNSSGLSELRTELARFQADALERARREGRCM